MRFLQILDHAGVLALFAPGCDLVLILHLLDEGAEHAHLRLLVLLKIKVVLLAEAQLQQVVVERLLRDVDLHGCLLERVAHHFAIVEHAVVQSAPQAHLLDDLLDGALLRPLHFHAPVRVLTRKDDFKVSDNLLRRRERHRNLRSIRRCSGRWRPCSPGAYPSRCACFCRSCQARLLA